MLKPKVKMTENIRIKIQKERMNKGISGIDLSKQIGKSEGWASLVENGRILTIKSIDLIKVFKILLDRTEEEIEQIISDLLNESKDKTEFDMSFYDELYKIDEKDFNKEMSTSKELFKIAFDKKNEYTIEQLKKFNNNIDTDIGFMLYLIGLPFHKLDTIPVDDKLKILKQIEQIVKSNIDIE